MPSAGSNESRASALLTSMVHLVDLFPDDVNALAVQGAQLLASVAEADLVQAWRRTERDVALLIPAELPAEFDELVWRPLEGTHAVDPPAGWSASATCAATLVLPGGVHVLLGWTAEVEDPAKEQAEMLARVLALGLRCVISERRSRELVLLVDEIEELAGVGHFDWDPQRGQKSWSDQLYRIFGLEPGSVSADHDSFLALLHPEDRERIERVYATALRSDSDYETVERIVRPDGEVRHLYSRGRAVKRGEDGATGLRGVRSDITKHVESTRLLEGWSRTAALALARRQQALQFNDTVLQGLTAAAMCLRDGDEAGVARHLDLALNTSRKLVADWLHPFEDRPVLPGDLVRTLRNEDRQAVGGPRPSVPPLIGPTTDLIRVLIVDDNAAVRELLVDQLEQTGKLTVVAEAADGNTAVALATRLRPDVVLLDLSMPRMDGLQALPLILAEVPEARVIVMSAFSEQALASQAIAAGAAHYLEKGVRMNVPAAIHAVLSIG